MDRTAWIAIILCALGMYFWYQSQPAPQPKPATPPGETPTEPVTPSEDGKESTTPDSPPGEPPPVAPAVDEETFVLKTPSTEFTLTNIGGGIAEARLLDHASAFASDIPVILNEYASYPVGAISKGIGSIEAYVYTISAKSERSVTFETDTPDNLHITKTYTLKDPSTPGSGYTLDLNLAIRNSDPAKAFQSSEVYLYTGGVAPLHAKEPSYQRGFSWFSDGSSDTRNVDKFRKKKNQNFEETTEALQWAGLVNQFFLTNISVETPYDANIWARRFRVELNEGEIDEENGNGDDKAIFGVHGGVGLPELNLPAGGEIALDYEIFLGPRSYTMLRDMGRERDSAMSYGDLPILGWLAAPFSKLLMSSMVKLYGWIGSYGLAILLITLIIKIIIWPLHNKSQRTMKRMSLLGPKMTEMREKYKDEPQRLNKEMMMLYKDYGVNPFGGCLPVLMQMPIFLGFFQMLRSAVELRHESFLWVRDLAMPDTIAHIAGFPINPLPLLMAVTMIIQMKVTPKTGDKTQQRIFMFMPLIFLVICYNFASALALYWTMQNVIGIGQTLLARRLPDPVLVKKPPRERPSLQQPGQQKKKPKQHQPRTGGGGAKRKKR